MLVSNEMWNLTKVVKNTVKNGQRLATTHFPRVRIGKLAIIQGSVTIRLSNYNFKSRNISTNARQPNAAACKSEIPKALRRSGGKISKERPSKIANIKLFCFCIAPRQYYVPLQILERRALSFPTKILRPVLVAMARIRMLAGMQASQEHVPLR